ncbi:hypothetical protein E2C01_073618 [Portunus trituberculatus]|uniref:Uncharacterized protein n=1 Tax=Portunus trituberculatus TaxID=210409 RepID=A0A5B7IA75_PORTR|nr:hypothetical protein [Portunus trituberculatus]
MYNDAAKIVEIYEARRRVYGKKCGTEQASSQNRHITHSSQVTTPGCGLESGEIALLLPRHRPHGAAERVEALLYDYKHLAAHSRRNT